MVSLSLVAAVCGGWTASVMAQDRPALRRFREGQHYVRKPGVEQTRALTDQPINAPVGPRPVVQCDEPIHDFGTVWTGPLLKHAFVIKNVGEGPLEIERVKPSCGCTVTKSYPRRIAPGSAGEFEFQMHSKKLRGNFEKTVSIMTNDPARRTLVLRLRGEIKQYVDLTPQHIYFGKLFGDEPAERVVRITNNTEKPLELQVLKPPAEQFDVKLVPAASGADYELRVAARPPYVPGRISDTVTLKTSVPQQDILTVPLRGDIPERLDLNPSVLTIQPFPETAKQPLRRIVRFTNYGASPARLLEVIADDPAITTAITEQKPGSAYLVQVEMPPGFEIPPEGRVLTFKTDDPEKPELTLPIQPFGLGRRTAQKPETQKRPAEQLVGQQAPAFAFETIDGRIITNDDLKDSVAVIDFFAVNCGFCKKQIPRIEKVRQDFEDQDVRFIAVSQTMRNKRFTDRQVHEKATELGFRGEVAADADNRVGPLFRATSFPTLVLLGKTGKVEAVHIGNTNDLETELSAQIKGLIEGKTAAEAQARADDEENTPPAPEAPDRAAGLFNAVETVAVESQVKPVAQPERKPVVQIERKRPDDLIGKPAPKFSLETFDGKPLDNDELTKQKATVLNFVAANCGFCKKQIPRLEKIREQFADKGVRFVNVVQTMRTPFTRDQLEGLMKQLGSNLELAHDPDNRVGPPFAATAYPTMVVVGGNGNVEAINVGNAADLETRVPAQLTALIEGKPVPKVARTQPQPTRVRPEQLVGKPAPPIAIETFEGKKLSNDDFSKNKATVLNFVAANCGFCKKQIPRLEKIRQQFAEKGVRFVNVFQTMRTPFTREQIGGILDQLGTKLEVAHDPDNKFGPPYGATGYPTMVIVGGTGKIEAVNVGNVADLETRVPTQLTALIEGKPIPQTAATRPSQPRRRPAEELEGKPAPSFTLTTIGGKTYSSENLKDHPATVLNFVAPNCGFCKRQVPNVEKIRKEFESKGVRFLNVAQKMRQDFTPEQIEKVFKDAGSNLDLAVSDFSTGAVGRQNFKVSGFPTLFVVGKDGVVKEVVVGARQDLETVLRAQLEELTKG